jgi:hypothetical protein
LFSATAASAAFGLNSPLEFIGSAQAQSYANAKLLDLTAYNYSVRGAGTFKKDGRGHAFAPVNA